MYRIVKRIVRTITTVTLFVRWEDAANQETVEEQIVLPVSHSLREEEVTDTNSNLENIHQLSNLTLDEGEKP